MNWIRDLFHWCNHTWVIHKEQYIFVNENRRGTLYILKCSKCGEITYRKVRV